ncbi:hypothetical protein COHA_002170 [Chlorella ohadii]|uniref:Uncharacterized protein n=1 Tax=Chlorella ohadii TaxID=2649997 RepID=A0AAD5H901_9CHLO|nr:hypothetical protein COHA_002170 [Chlorella ohadii]
MPLRRCGECAACLVDKKKRPPCLELQRQRLERQNAADGGAGLEEGGPLAGGEEAQMLEGQRAGGMPRTASGRLAFQGDKSLMLFTSPYDRKTRFQHLANLVFLLRHSVATHDWRRVAGLAATLLASDRAENLGEKWMFRHPDSRARVAEALEAGKQHCWLLLQHHPDALSYEQTRRYLQQWAVFQIAPAGKEAVLLQLARYCREQGHATDAWDFLSTQQFSTAAAEAQRHALMGGIRAEAWMQAMRGAAQQMAVVQHPTGSPNKRRRGGPQRSAAWEPWQHSAQITARAGRMARELHEQAVESCQKSLELQPEATLVAHMLAQLQLAAGDANVWQHLAATLVQAAALLAQCQQRLSELQQQRQALLPRSLHEAHQQLQRRQHGEGSSREQERWAELQELTAAAVEAQGQLRLALQAYERCCAVVEGRLWWRDAHLLPQPAETVAAALQTGSADPAVVLALAAVNAFLHPLWQRQAVQQWRASGGAIPLPRLLHNVLSRHSAAALHAAGHEQEAAALRAAVKLCRKAAAAAAGAAEASSSGGHATAALASIARQRADFWRAARRPWKPPAGWVPVPLGARHPQLGRIDPLPHQWWACFPQYRRKQRHDARDGEPEAAAAATAGGAEAAAEPWAATIAAAAAAIMAAAGTSPGLTPASQAPYQPVIGGRRQPQALRRLQAPPQPGVRSILKGSQEQPLDDEWPGASQAQQAPGSGRAARRVQFQLPHSPSAGAARERGSQQQQQVQEQQHEAEDMDVDGSGSMERPQQGAAAAAAGQADGGAAPRHGKGRRRLLPQLPAALAEDDGDGGSGMGAGTGAWRAKLQRRRSSLQQQQQQQQPRGSGW